MDILIGFRYEEWLKKRAKVDQDVHDLVNLKIITVVIIDVFQLLLGCRLCKAKVLISRTPRT